MILPLRKHLIHLFTVILGQHYFLTIKQKPIYLTSDSKYLYVEFRGENQQTGCAAICSKCLKVEPTLKIIIQLQLTF